MSKPSSISVLVIDSCIWIDLANGIVLEEVFRLPHKIIDPDVLTQEEVRPTNWEKLANLGLNFIPASSDEMVEVLSIYNKANRRVSFYDASALELAKRVNCLLLTDDRQLINTAQEHSVQVGGITWLLDVMVMHGCISGTKASAALERINQSGHAIHSEEMSKWKEKWAMK